MESAGNVPSNTGLEKGKQPALTATALATRISRVPSGYKKVDHRLPVYPPIIESLMRQVEEVLRDYSHAANGNVWVGTSNRNLRL